MKSVAYLRVSKDTQDVKNQRLAILDFAQKEKFEIDRFIELQISSRKSTRERKIDTLLEQLHPGDTLIVSESTRGWPVGPGAVSALGFWTDDVALAYDQLAQRGVAVGAPPSARTPLPGMSRRAFAFEGLDGLRLEIAQRI